MCNGTRMRWTNRPEGSTWGDWGDDDELGRVNLITPQKVLDGVAEVRCEFCGQQYRFNPAQIAELFDHPAVDMEAPARLQ